MRTPLSKHIKRIISKRKNASKLVKKIVQHDSKSKRGDDIVIDFENNEKIILKKARGKL